MKHIPRQPRRTHLHGKVGSKMGTEKPFSFCLNTSTIKGTLLEKIAIAEEAGYDGIEPWAREIDAYVKEGGSTAELGKRFSDAGLKPVSLIAFFEWAVDDDAKRAAGLEEARRVLDMARAIGCDRIAAPPSGLLDAPALDLPAVAQRYHTLLEIGREYGVVPVLEFWGISKVLGCLGEAVAVAAESGHADACVLVDIFHMYKHQSSFEGIRLLNGSTIGLVHINDYPAEPPRETIRDAQRVFPVDGVAPLGSILGTLGRIGYNGYLSLELFNESYYARDPLSVAKEGLAKTNDAVARALSRTAGA
jgi:2-keto-myo-inositol isomerase